MAICECLSEIDSGRVRNFCVSVLSGVLFSIAWWIVIDAAVMFADNDQLPKAYHTIGVFGTIAFLMINSVPNAALNDEYSDSRIGRCGAYICLFIAFSMTFSCVIAACWVLFGGYVGQGKTPIWPGVAILLQNVLLCISSLIFRFGRKNPEDF